MKLKKFPVILAATMMLPLLVAPPVRAATQYPFTIATNSSATGLWNMTLTMMDPHSWTYSIAADTATPPSQDLFKFTIYAMGVPEPNGGVVSTLGVTGTGQTNSSWNVTNGMDGRSVTGSTYPTSAQNVLRTGANSLTGTLSFADTAPFLLLQVSLNNGDWYAWSKVVPMTGEVPVPAAGYTMMTALGGLAAVARKRKVAAQTCR